MTLNKMQRPSNLLKGSPPKRILVKVQKPLNGTVNCLVYDRGRSYMIQQYVPDWVLKGMGERNQLKAFFWAAWDSEHQKWAIKGYAGDAESQSW